MLCLHFYPGVRRKSIGNNTSNATGIGCDPTMCKASTLQHSLFPPKTLQLLPIEPSIKPHLIAWPRTMVFQHFFQTHPQNKRQTRSYPHIFLSQYLYILMTDKMVSKHGISDVLHLVYALHIFLSNHWNWRYFFTSGNIPEILLIFNACQTNQRPKQN